VRQLDADLRRFFARRIVRGAFILAFLIAVLAVTIPTVRGHPARTGNAAPIQIRVGTAPDGSPVYEYVAPPGSSRDTRIDVGKSLEDVFRGVSILMVFVGVVLGASFVGAEFHLGSLTSQLLYEPRRWRVHLAKAATVGLGCAVFAAFLCVVVAGLMLAGSELHGVVRGLDSSWWRHRGVQVGRAMAACAFAAIMSYTVAVITRRTSAAIVVFFVMYPFIGIVHSSAPVFGLASRYAPIRGLLSVAFGPPNGGNDVDLLTRTGAGGIALTVVWVVVLVAASGGVFSRSEVR
jgi:hypothetical protein